SHPLVGLDQLLLRGGVPRLVKPEPAGRGALADAGADAQPAVDRYPPRRHSSSQVTGSSRTLAMAWPARNSSADMGTVIRSPGSPVSSPRNASCNSIRASCAPRQWCAPAPKARWVLGARPTSSRSGSTNAAGSRFAVLNDGSTVSPAGIVTPP